MDVAAVTSRTIREEVAELLGIGPGDVDPDSDLIGQGLDSIRMMSLAGKWRKRGVAVDFAALAASPSVRAWSELVTGSGESHLADDRQEVAVPLVDSGALVDAAEHQPFPLASMQHAMWVGRESEQQLGGVAGHLYVEFDGDAVALDPLSRAATASRISLSRRGASACLRGRPGRPRSRPRRCGSCRAAAGRCGTCCRARGSGTGRPPRSGA